MANLPKGCEYKTSTGKNGGKTQRVTNFIKYLGYGDLTNWIKMNPLHNMLSKLGTDMGSIVHDAAECEVFGQEYARNLTDHQKKIVDNSMIRFRAFLKDSGVEVLESEKMVVSEKNRVAGTCDLILRFHKDYTFEQWSYNLKKYITTTIKKGTYVFDFKTSNGIYSSAFLQMMTYHKIIEECNTYPVEIYERLEKFNNNEIFQYYHNIIRLDRGVGVISFNKTILDDDPNSGFMIAFADGAEFDRYERLHEICCELREIEPKNTQKEFLGIFKGLPKEATKEEVEIKKVTEKLKEVLHNPKGLSILSKMLGMNKPEEKPDDSLLIW